ncbi:MAG TPA: nuclear transport factor 2 family protein [Acidimicrobiales bacterium]|nr:nuclear transport factor 2 family protein [Acidimicrobiales bacterium]
MTEAELATRERIRDTLARYSWGGDSLRLDDVAASFCEDGELEIRGGEVHRGREAIVAYIGGVGRRDAAPAAPPGPAGGRRPIVRHSVSNVRFVELHPDHALVVAYFTVFTEIGLDHYGRYRDRFVPVGDEWLIRHRFVSTDWAAAGSTMVASPAATP